VVAYVLTSPRVRLAVLLAFLLSAAGAVLLIGGPSSSSIAHTVRATGVGAPVVFVALYAALTVLLFPGSVGSVAAGALFGVVLGTVLTVLAAIIGATASFYLGRRLGRAGVERVAGARARKLNRFLNRHGFATVLYLRLIPIVPFNVFNYACGTTGVRGRDYCLATGLGIIPGSFAYVALGHSLRSPLSPEFLGATGLIVVLSVVGPIARLLGRRRVRAHRALLGDDIGAGS
jgi:uncharacterized membrane protein YdjX (TVP38/TMEM64 family)